jgi:hypothetical protein
MAVLSLRGTKGISSPFFFNNGSSSPFTIKFCHKNWIIKALKRIIALTLLTK